MMGVGERGGEGGRVRGGRDMNRRREEGRGEWRTTGKERIKASMEKLRGWEWVWLVGLLLFVCDRHVG